MDEEHEHGQILNESGDQFQPLFETSRDGICFYIDEVHKICNDRFARMLGLTVSEWEKMEGFVNKPMAEQDQGTIVEA